MLKARWERERGLLRWSRQLTLALAWCCGMEACARPPSAPASAAVVAAPEGDAVASGAAAPDTAARDAVVHGRRLRYHLQLAEQPNLVYQLDCVAGVVLCARPIFVELWDTFSLDEEDRSSLTVWKALRTRYGGQLQRVAGFLGSSGAFDLAERQRIAGLRARTPVDFEQMVAVLCSSEDARALHTILQRFAPRFRVWWSEHGLVAGAESFAGFERLLADPFLDGTIDRVAAFYEAHLPEGVVFPIHLVVQPRSDRRLSVAYQLEGDAVVEVREDTRPEAMIEIIAHELFHYFLFRMEPRRRAAMLEAVTASKVPYAAVSFGMFDEAVAAALGNGVVGSHYQPPARFEARRARGFIQQYRAAGAVARDLYAVLPDLLERGTRISSEEFLNTYFQAALATYPEGRPRPLDYLHSQISVSKPRFAPAAEQLKEAASAGFPYLREYAGLDAARDFLLEHPRVNSALFLPIEASLAQSLRPFDTEGTHLSAVGALAERGRAFVYALPRAQDSYAFLFAGKTSEAMRDLVERFTALESMQAGLLVE